MSLGPAFMNLSARAGMAGAGLLDLGSRFSARNKVVAGSAEDHTYNPTLSYIPVTELDAPVPEPETPEVPEVVDPESEVYNTEISYIPLDEVETPEPGLFEAALDIPDASITAAGRFDYSSYLNGFRSKRQEPETTVDGTDETAAVEPLVLTPEEEEHVKEVLARLKLTPAVKFDINRFSGGFKRRQEEDAALDTEPEDTPVPELTPEPKNNLTNFLIPRPPPLAATRFDPNRFSGRFRRATSSKRQEEEEEVEEEEAATSTLDDANVPPELTPEEEANLDLVLSRLQFAPAVKFDINRFSGGFKRSTMGRRQEEDAATEPELEDTDVAELTPEEQAKLDEVLARLKFTPAIGFDINRFSAGFKRSTIAELD